MRLGKFYEYEDRNNCRECGGILRYTGSLNHDDYFECLNCHIKFKVERKSVISDDGRVKFNGYGKPEYYK